ncbi:GerMN domain-containing protein [Arthrobacter sp. K5]|uniref:GerMN domain-containing protein n=1 Tax=Arthrobacter sp. K5 TaxID=2839623 RepID=A0AAU8EM20_9MICC
MNPPGEAGSPAASGSGPGPALGASGQGAGQGTAGQGTTGHGTGAGVSEPVPSAGLAPPSAGSNPGGPTAGEPAGVGPDTQAQLPGESGDQPAPASGAAAGPASPGPTTGPNAPGSMSPGSMSPGAGPGAASGAASAGTAVYYVAIDDGGRSGVRFGCNDSLVAVRNADSAISEPLQAAMSRLLSGPGAPPASGLYNALSASSLQYVSGYLDGTTVVVNLTGAVQPGGVCDLPRIEAQLTHTAVTAVGAVRAEIYVSGVPLADVLGLS